MNELVDVPKATAALSDRQKRLVEGIIEGKPDSEAGELAGYETKQGWRQALRSFPVQAALLEHRKGRISGMMAASALDAINELITDNKTPAATRLAASKWVLEQAGHGGQAEDDRDVPLHEMSAEQLSRFMAKANAVIEAGGEPPTITVTSDNGA